MASVEGPSGQRNEITVTDLTQTEGLPSPRGRTVDEDGIASRLGEKADQQSDPKGVEVTGWFRGPWMSAGGSLRTDAAESSPVHRSLAAMVPGFLGPLLGVLFGWVFLGSSVPDEYVFLVSAVIAGSGLALAWYLARSPKPNPPASDGTAGNDERL